MNDEDGLELTPEVRHRALLDRLRDLDHLGRALIGVEHPTHQEHAGEERKERSPDREEQPEPFGAAELERLVASFPGRENYVPHRLRDSLVGDRPIGSIRPKMTARPPRRSRLDRAGGGGARGTNVARHGTGAIRAKSICEREFPR
jgi:hypothetical protein